MNKTYLFVPSITDQSRSLLLDGQYTISYTDSDPSFEKGDKMLLVHTKGESYDAVLPVIARITEVNKTYHKVTLETEKNYNQHVSIDTIRSILNRSIGVGATPLTQNDVEAITSQMGGVRPKESELLNYIKKYIAAKGYYFDDETLYNYHICLKTRPFVILAGLSGTGKSKLSQLYAEAIGHSVQNKHYLRLAVRPSWNDDRFLLGYLNTITNEYITEPAIDFIMKAEEDRENLYFFCLDEMNLAHVEYYFSQFLSALEEESPKDRRIHLVSENVDARLKKRGNNEAMPSFVLIPTNLLFTGTINVDETTQPLSDKVIDRANTIEFFSVELDKVPERQPLPDPLSISATTWQSYQTSHLDTSYRTHIIEISKILNSADLGLGYRTLREIELYLANSKQLLKPEVAFDLQVKQRILPRVRGTEAILSALDRLSTFLKSYTLVRSEKRLDEMKARLKRDGYTNFWR